MKTAIGLRPRRTRNFETDGRAPDLTVVHQLPEDCPVCGLGRAFDRPGAFDTCARCGWVDDPAAYGDPAAASAANETSLEAAIATWPQRAVAMVARGPVAELAVRPPTRSGQYEFFIDGRSLSKFFAVPNGLQAAFGWDGASGEAGGPLETGAGTRESGRVSLLVCGECEDRFEDALTADVCIAGERTVWSRIGIESIVYTERGRGLEAGGYWLDLTSGPVGFAFDTAAYRAALAFARRL